jgi:hypothetical protein
MSTPRFYDFVKVQTATTGTGTITLGAEVGSFRSFATASIPDGTPVRYVIADPGIAPTQRESGTGIYTASGTTLSRILGSSTTGALLALSGAAHVSISPMSEDLSHAQNSKLAVTSDTTLAIPYGYAIAGIYIVNTTANAITGGLKIGTTAGATDVVAAQTVGANALVSVPYVDLLKRLFSMSVNQTLYIQAVSSWNSASITISFDLYRV